jgi:hypothetical protein
MAAEQPMGRVPVPDPTALTTEALKLSIANLKELMEAKLASNEKATASDFKELHVRLCLIEKQRLELKADSTKALEAALVAQERLFDQKNKCNEEAAAKAEAAFTKQIESLRSEAQIAREGLSERINGVKERIDRGEGRGAGISQLAGWIFGAVGMVVGLIAIFSWLTTMQPKVERNSEFREQVTPSLQAKP